MIDLLKTSATKGWRLQLIAHLKEDPVFIDSLDDPREFLVALSSVSDDLKADEPMGLREFDAGCRLWFKVFSLIPEDERLAFIERLFSESAGVSIPLLILEHLRDRNQATFFDGIRAGFEVPAASLEDIERLTDLIFPEVKLQFRSRRFPISADEEFRFYRLAHALGPERVEKLLVPEVSSDDLESSWAITKAVIGGLRPSLNLNLFAKGSVGELASQHILARLSQFASEEHWMMFAETAAGRGGLDEEKATILLHIETGYRVVRDKERASENSEDILQPEE